MIPTISYLCNVHAMRLAHLIQMLRVVSDVVDVNHGIVNLFVGADRKQRVVRIDVSAKELSGSWRAEAERLFLEQIQGAIGHSQVEYPEVTVIATSVKHVHILLIESNLFSRF